MWKLPECVLFIKDTKPNLDEFSGEDYYLFGLDFRVEK